MPVTGLVGLAGSGKTLRAVQMACEAMERGVDVYANFSLGRREWGYIDLDGRFVPEAGLRDKRARRLKEAGGVRVGRGFVADERAFRLTSWEQVLAIRESRDAFGVPHRLQLQAGGYVETKDGREEIWTAVPTCDVAKCNGCSRGILVVIDELNLWAPSRFWQRMEIGHLNRWAYNRKDGLHIVWTAQHEARVDKVAREVTDFIYACSLAGIRGASGDLARISLGPLSFRLGVFQRRRFVPALLTDRNRVVEGEGATGGGLFSGNVQVAFWWSMRGVADRYDTSEHVSDAWANEGGGRESGRRPRVVA